MPSSYKTCGGKDGLSDLKSATRGEGQYVSGSFLDGN